MKHKIKMAAAILPLVLGSGIANAETDLFGGKVKAGGYLAQHWQSALEVKGNLNSQADGQADSGFQRLRTGLWFNVDVADRVSVFMELAEEPNDYGATFSINQDLAWIELQVQEGMALRVGNVVESTMNFLRYSDGAAVQGNPLIGNGVNDMIAAVHGLWLTGGSDTSFGKWDYNLTLTKPSFFDDFSVESGYNYGARSSITTAGGFGLGAGIFITDGDVTGCPTTTTCTLGSGSATRTLFARGDGDHYSVGQQGVTSKNVAGILPGISARIWQIDAMWSGDALGKPVTIHGFYGEGEDDFSHTGGSFIANTTSTFSTTDAEQSFWGIFGRVDLTDKFYLATRYGVSENETSGAGGQNELDRIQVGAGYWFADSSLLKVEYVRQEGEAQSGARSCSFAGTGDCKWEGVVAELSVSF
jgi:hypothetical protein